MSDRSSGRKKRGNNMRFRPNGGVHKASKRVEKAAREARAEIVGEKSADEPIFANETRHESEIAIAENEAAGIPATSEENAAPEGEKRSRGRRRRGRRGDRSGDSQENNTPPAEEPAKQEAPKAKAKPAKKEAPKKAPSYEPVTIEEPPPKTLVEAIKAKADKVISKVKNLIAEEKETYTEVIINAESLETRVAVLENGKLEEFNIERREEERLVGSIFKGKVKNLEDGLKAAFVDIGFEKNAFLHYWDIVPSNLDSGVEVVERPVNKKKAKPRFTQKDIPKLFPAGSEIIIQVTKGPIGTKGPRVTTHLAIPGRYLVLLPNSDQCGISRKISDNKERQRLKKILRELNIPEGMGVIIRTVGEGQRKAFFVRDLALLLEEWREVQERINSQPLATCVFHEPDLIDRTVRDFLTDKVDRIVIDGQQEADRIKTLIGKISKRSVSKVKHYNESQPVFDRFGVTRQLENTFSRQVPLKSGGYIVIDETEALVAIDVNTGSHRNANTKDQDGTIFKVNMEAAEEITRQLRLRNIGGLIVLDFIDMKHRKDQQMVYNAVKNGLKRDKSKTHILPISALGLMEMTRQRHSESVRSAVYDDCRECHGRGKVKSPLTMSVEIQRKLQEILRKRDRDESDFQLRVHVNPKVLHRLRNEDEALIIEMEKKHFTKLAFRGEPDYHIETYKIINGLTNKELASETR